MSGLKDSVPGQQGLRRSMGAGGGARGKVTVLRKEASDRDRRSSVLRIRSDFYLAGAVMLHDAFLSQSLKIKT